MPTGTAQRERPTPPNSLHPLINFPRLDFAAGFEIPHGRKPSVAPFPETQVNNNEVDRRLQLSPNDH